VVTPSIERMRLAGESSTDAFKRLHGQASMLFVARTAMLLVVGFMLPKAIQLMPRAARKSESI
jgi:hypothetical protein